MTATWSGSSDDSIEGDETSDDEDLMANFLVFASSHKSKSGSEREEGDQVDSDSSEDGTNCSFVKKEVLDECLAKFKSLEIKTTRKIQRLRNENLNPSSLNDTLSEQLEESKKMEDKLRSELDLFFRNEEVLKRELEEAKKSIARMTSSTEKLDLILGVGKNSSDKRGLGFKESKETSTSKKTVFVKSLGCIEASPMHTSRRKLELGQSSKSAQVNVAPPRQPQVNSPQHLAQ